jgi:glucans biosynthesis protein C
VEVSAQGPTPTTEGTKPGKTRIYFVDYLRGALVTLVILHHTAITYGGSGSFYYTETATDPLAALVLTLFTNFNQAWFLGCFFLISGYFSPASFDRKGPRRFLKDRLIRLGIPLLVFFFVLNPITVYIAFSHLPASQVVAAGFTLPLTFNWQFFVNSVGTGPLWFVEMLLIFEFGYALWRTARWRSVEARGEKERPFPSYRKISTFILVLALSAYLLRIIVPINAQVLGFPSLFDLPQYLSFFIVGTAAARGDWLRKMPDTMATRFFRVALVASATLLILAIVGTEASSLGWGSLVGYGSLSSAFYALWDSTFAVGMTMFAIAYFRRHFDHPGKLWGFSSKNFYAAFILQAPVIVTVAAVLLPSVHIESLLKFGLAAVIIVPLTWALAYLVMRIPLVDRAL